MVGGGGGGSGQTGEGVLENTPYIEVNLNTDGACVLTRCNLNLIIVQSNTL